MGESQLIAAVRKGDSAAWQELVEKYRGRLMRYVIGRVGNEATAEDLAQETLLGFYTSLPHYDESQPLENYLFRIAAFKLTDWMRREGRRPALSAVETESQPLDAPDFRSRAVSSAAQSVERRGVEAAALAKAMAEQIARLRERGDWQKLMCLEALLVRGMANKRVAELLSLTEQQVANFKADFLMRIKTLVGRQGLSAAMFPELADGAP